MTRIDDTSWLCAHVNVDFFQAQRYWKLPPSRKQRLSRERSFMAIMAFSYIFLYTRCSLLATIRLDTMHTIRSYGNQFDVECTIKFRFHEEAYPFGLIDLQSIWDAKAFQIHWSICNTAARLLRVNWLSTRSHRFSTPTSASILPLTKSLVMYPHINASSKWLSTPQAKRTYVSHRSGLTLDPLRLWTEITGPCRSFSCQNRWEHSWSWSFGSLLDHFARILWLRLWSTSKMAPILAMEHH